MIQIMPASCSAPCCDDPVTQRLELIFEKIDEKIQHLSLHFFLYASSNLFSSVDFFIRPVQAIQGTYLTAIFEEIIKKQGFRVADVYPLNGTVKSGNFKITDFIRGSHRQEIQTQIALLNQKDPKGQFVRCLVIDFKDRKGKYRCSSEIHSTENEFARFFQAKINPKSKIQKEIFNLIRGSHIDFFINEGSLKADLIREVFNAEQSDFLMDTEEGSRLLCQICEVIMNGFKQGCEVQVNGHVFSPNDYLVPTKNTTKSNIHLEQLSRLGPPRLMTFYPPFYRQLYSEGSQYYQLINHVFKVTHAYEQGTTIITIDP